MRGLRGAVVGAVALVSSGCGEGVPVINTAPAEAALAQLVDDSGFPDPTFVVLSECPITDGPLLLERALADIDSAFVELALAADDVAFVSAPLEAADGDPYTACGHLADEGVGVALTIADAPGDGVGTIDTEFNPMPGDAESDALRDATAETYAARFGDVPQNLTIDRGDDTRGGTFYRICIAEPTTPERDSCEVAWFGGDLVVSTLVTGPGATEVDLAAVEERFSPLIQLVVDGLTTDER